MTREEAKKIALAEIDKDIEKNGEDAIFCKAPQPGKNSWTLKEARESVINDTELENSGMNIIDSVIKLDEYLLERGLSSLVDIHLKDDKEEQV